MGCVYPVSVFCVRVSSSSGSTVKGIFVIEGCDCFSGIMGVVKVGVCAMSEFVKLL